MSFDTSLADLYNFGIKAACEEAGADCARVDEQVFLERILDRIYGQIERADLIVAEMTGHKPNVYYETGFAHGIGKPVFLLTKSADEIPFDLRHHPHIVHSGSIATLREKLREKVEWFLTNPDEAKSALQHRSLTKPNDSVLSETERMAQHIINYLRANNFTMVSFERVRENINESYSDEMLLRLIDESPHRFRRTRLPGNRPGVGIVAE
jgi:hypothetical protein